MTPLSTHKSTPGINRLRAVISDQRAANSLVGHTKASYAYGECAGAGALLCVFPCFPHSMSSYSSIKPNGIVLQCRCWAVNLRQWLSAVNGPPGTPRRCLS